MHHGRQAAGAVILLAEIFAGRLHVDQERHVETDLFPILDGELHADVARDGIDVDRRIGRAAEAEQATIAFSNSARVRMSVGLSCSCTIATARTPVS